MKKLLILGLALAAVIVFNGQSSARGSEKPKPFAAHCYCKAIVFIGNDAGTSISNPIIDFGTLGSSWATPVGHNTECEQRCSAAAAQDANFNNKTWLCQHIMQPGNQRVSAYSSVGTGAGSHYRVAQSIYTTCSGGGTTCTCPSAWMSNTNVAGGITTDGKCKKLACQESGISPAPPNGTQIGSWGFTWGNGFWAWGSAANGGSPNCVSSPWIGV